MEVQMKLLTVREIARALQVSYETALHMVKHDMRYIRLGRQYRVTEESFAQYIRLLERRSR